VRDGIFEIDDDGVRAMQNGAFGWKARLLTARHPTGKSTRFLRLTLTAVNYNTSIGLESSFNKKG
jgi:hypothetical protein